MLRGAFVKLSLIVTRLIFISEPLRVLFSIPFFLLIEPTNGVNLESARVPKQATELETPARRFPDVLVTVKEKLAVIVAFFPSHPIKVMKILFLRIKGLVKGSTEGFVRVIERSEGRLQIVNGKCGPQRRCGGEPPPLNWSASIVRKAEDPRWL